MPFRNAKLRFCLSTQAEKTLHQSPSNEGWAFCNAASNLSVKSESVSLAAVELLQLPCSVTPSIYESIHILGLQAVIHHICKAVWPSSTCLAPSQKKKNVAIHEGSVEHNHFRIVLLFNCFHSTDFIGFYMILPISLVLLVLKKQSSNPLCFFSKDCILNLPTCNCHQPGIHRVHYKEEAPQDNAVDLGNSDRSSLHLKMAVTWVIGLSQIQWLRTPTACTLPILTTRSMQTTFLQFAKNSPNTTFCDTAVEDRNAYRINIIYIHI